MNKYLLPTLFSTVLVISCVNAETVQWLENGDAMHGNTTEVTEKESLNHTSADLQTPEDQSTEHRMTLATGQNVILTGGVYVKSDDTAGVLAWAATNDYIALDDPYIKGALHVQTTPEESIRVANLIAEISGVTTSAPKYRMPVVAK